MVLPSPSIKYTKTIMAYQLGNIFCSIIAFTFLAMYILFYTSSQMNTKLSPLSPLYLKSFFYLSSSFFFFFLFKKSGKKREEAMWLWLCACVCICGSACVSECVCESECVCVEGGEGRWKGGGYNRTRPTLPDSKSRPIL